jgi:hypothetical protein
VDSGEGMVIFEAVGSKLIEKPPVAVPDEHAELVKADQRFQDRLHVAIAAGHESIEAMQATVQLKPRRKKLPR